MPFGLFEKERWTTKSLQASLNVRLVAPPPRFGIPGYKLTEDGVTYLFKKTQDVSTSTSGRFIAANAMASAFD